MAREDMTPRERLQAVASWTGLNRALSRVSSVLP